ncbi:hypothetical protein M5X11_28880 [Paenibacillus alginolyticus]|nr:hypothetical protein [Paenibacillus alginolyticus]MCY9668892.1 hypothetical protein [Paenibacillus alginolyticus]
MDYFTSIYNIDPDEAISLSNKFCDSNDFVENLISRDFSEEMIPLFIYLLKILDKDKDKRTILKKWIFTHLTDFNKKVWKVSLQKRDNLYLFLKELTLEEGHFLGLEYADALLDSIKDYPSGFSKKGDLLKFFNIIDAPYKKDISQNLRQYLTYSDNSITLILDELASELFSESVALTEEYINQLVNGGFSKIVDRSDEAELESLIKVLSLRSDIVSNCNFDYWNTFIDRLEKRYEDTEDGTELQTIYFKLKELSTNLTEKLKYKGLKWTGLRILQRVFKSTSSRIPRNYLYELFWPTKRICIKCRLRGNAVLIVTLVLTESSNL